jgi:hypothetical protein
MYTLHTSQIDILGVSLSNDVYMYSSSIRRIFADVECEVIVARSLLVGAVQHIIQLFRRR